MPESEHYDLLVVGGGPVGLSTAWHATRRGASVLALDRYGFMNERCGTSGAERHWRVQYTQRDLFELTLETQPMWRELERLAERKLIHAVGSLWFGDVDVETNEGQISGTARIMDELSVPYEWLTAAEIERRYGFTALPRAYEGFLQPDGGTIDVRGTVAALYQLAQAGGAVLRTEGVLELRPDADGVTVRTGDRTYRAGKVVLANGPHVNDLLEPLGAGLDVHLYEMALVTLRQRDLSANYPFWFLFQPESEEDTNLFYGFPRNPWSTGDEVRLGPDFEVNPLAGAAAATGTPDPRHVERVCGLVREHLPAIDPVPVRTSTCLAVLPADPDRQFYLGDARGRFDGGEHVVLSAAGWGFKFVPLLGKVCTELCLDGRTGHDVERLVPGAAAVTGGHP